MKKLFSLLLILSFLIGGCVKIKAPGEIKGDMEGSTTIHHEDLITEETEVVYFYLKGGSDEKKAEEIAEELGMEIISSPNSIGRYVVEAPDKKTAEEAVKYLEERGDIDTAGAETAVPSTTN